MTQHLLKPGNHEQHCHTKQAAMNRLIQAYANWGRMSKPELVGELEKHQGHCAKAAYLVAGVKSDVFDEILRLGRRSYVDLNTLSWIWQKSLIRQTPFAHHPEGEQWAKQVVETLLLASQGRHQSPSACQNSPQRGMVCFKHPDTSTEISAHDQSFPAVTQPGK